MKEVAEQFNKLSKEERRTVTAVGVVLLVLFWIVAFNILRPAG